MAGVDVALSEAMVSKVWDCLPVNVVPKQSPASEPTQPEESPDLELPGQGSIFLSPAVDIYFS